jgi:MFS transporter, DHA1 family, multidrug resistance protein
MEQKTPGAAFAASLAAITLISPLAIHLFLPALPGMAAEFGASGALAQLTFSITLMTMAVVTPAYGTVSDRYGRRPVLLTGLGLFLFGSLVSAVASNLPLLLAGRIIQASGAGCGLTLTRAIARDAYGPAALVKAIAYLTIAYALGPMIAPPFGGLLIDAFGWRSVFWFALVTGAVIMTAAVVLLYETRGRAEREAQPIRVVSLYAELMRDRAFLGFVLQSGFMSFAFFAVAGASPFLVTGLLGRTPGEYGLMFACFPVGYCTGNIISSRLSGKVSIEKMVLTGSLICLVAATVQSALILAGQMSPAVIFGPGAFITFAQGLSLPNAQAGAIRVKPALAGTAAGLGVFIQMLLSAVSTELYGVFADGTPIPMIVLSWLGAVMATAAAASLFTGPARKAG